MWYYFIVLNRYGRGVYSKRNEIYDIVTNIIEEENVCLHEPNAWNELIQFFSKHYKKIKKFQKLPKIQKKNLKSFKKQIIKKELQKLQNQKTSLKNFIIFLEKTASNSSRKSFKIFKKELKNLQKRPPKKPSL